MLIDELQRNGDWLFRHRSYVPLILLPLAAIAIAQRTHYLLDSPGWNLGFELFCFAISLTGLAIRFVTLGYAGPGSSGRNTREQIADTLNTTGMYSICRHPLYLGNTVMMAGVMLFTQSILLTGIGILGYIVFYERIIAREEQFLETKFGAVFREWASRTPFMLPRFRQRRSAETDAA